MREFCYSYLAFAGNVTFLERFYYTHYRSFPYFIKAWLDGKLTQQNPHWVFLVLHYAEV